MDRRHGTALVIGIIALSLSAPLIFAAATEETAAEVATEEDYVAFDTYHWATPAEFEQATGQAIGDYGEAPMLAEMVAAGELPPVEDRLPNEPLVIGKKIGKYGGTMYMANPWKAWSYGAEPYSLYGFGIAEHTWTYHIYPNLAKSYDMEDAGRAWVIHLREGLKWSDGAPFTADDVVFWWEDITTMQPHPDVFTKHQMETHVYKGVEKIDDYTLRFTFNGPTRDVFFSVQAGKAIAGFAKHYFEQFHPTYADAADLDALVQEGGFDSWQTLFANKFDQRGLHNTERPVLLPWTLSKGTPGDIIMIRNPYYWVVDPAGQSAPLYRRAVPLHGAGAGNHQLEGARRRAGHRARQYGDLQPRQGPRRPGQDRSGTVRGFGSRAHLVRIQLDAPGSGPERDLSGQAVSIRHLPCPQS